VDIWHTKILFKSGESRVNVKINIVPLIKQLDKLHVRGMQLITSLFSLIWRIKLFEAFVAQVKMN